MAAEVTIVVVPSDTEAGSFDIYQFVYSINGDPQPDPIIVESNVPESSFISGYTVIIADNAYGIRLVSNNDRGFGCVNDPIDHFFSSVQISNNFLSGNLSITGITFGSTSFTPLPGQNETIIISLNTGTTIQDTTTVGIYNNEPINVLSYQIIIRDSDNILPFIYSDTISPLSGEEINFTGTTISPDRQFRLLLNSFVQPSTTPSISVSQTMPASPTVTPTVTASQGLSPSKTPTITPTRTVSASPGLSPTLTPTRTLTPTVTASTGLSPTLTPSVTPTITPSITTSPTITPTRTLSKTVTPSITTSVSFTPSKTPTHSVTPTPSTPAWELVMITNTNGVYSISSVTVNGVLVSDVTYPISAGNQVNGTTTQRGIYTVIVTLSSASSGEHIKVDSDCLPTTGSNPLIFPTIQTIGGVMITYGAGPIC